MADISIDWGTKIITIPQDYLTPVSGTLYELNVNTFRLDLKGLENSTEGIPFLDTHRHSTEVVLGGITYARFVEIINGYTITFGEGSYRVRLVGANNNILDVLNLNYVQVLALNSAGLQVVTQGSGVTSQDKTDIISGTVEAVWAYERQ